MVRKVVRVEGILADVRMGNSFNADIVVSWREFRPFSPETWANMETKARRSYLGV